MSAPDTIATTNPFPGLRPFLKEEEHLFFGREKQVDAMVDKLAKTHFLAVVGTSGSGKSSLVNCGLRPALHRGAMLQVGTVWHIAQFRPGSNPIRAMSEALAREGVLYSGFKSEDFGLAEILESALRTSKLGLITAYEQARLSKDANLLVVADQFEELFRYQKIGVSRGESIYGLSEEAVVFVNLLREVREHPSLRIYVVLTLRSDFLGDCAQFSGLPEAINEGQYLVPRMSRDERRLAIVGPVGVGGADIDPALVTRLVNDAGDNPDQLSILQHALNRTWASWENEGRRQGRLELKHYEAIGTMAHALHQHAERAFGELDTERKQKICEGIMKALTDWSIDARGTRRPTKLSTLCVLVEASQAEVTGVIDVFRKPSRSFLMPPAAERLDEETVIDISHESLMRVWDRLKTWGEEEARSVQVYRLLCEWAHRWDMGRTDLWRGPDLASATAWREREKPKPQWAERYGSHDDFQLATRFLDASEQAQRAAVEAEETKRQNQLRLARFWALSFGAVTAILILGILGYFVAFRWNHDRYFAHYVKVFGIPRGIGPLRVEQVRHRALSYKITTKGRYGSAVTHMEAVNDLGNPTTGGMTTGFETSSWETAKREVRWEYVYDANGRVAYEVSLDRNGQRVRSIAYSPIDQKTPNSRSAYMIGKEGSLAPQVSSCAAVLKYEYSEAGYEVRTHYLDQIGNPTAGRDDVFIMEREFDQHGNDIKVLSLGRDNRPMNDRVGNAEVRYRNDDLGNPLEGETSDAAGAPINIKGKNWQRVTFTYDAHGNQTEQVFWNANRRPSMEDNGCHRLRLTYDERGYMVQTECLDQDKRLVSTFDGFATWKVMYDDKGRVTEYTYYDKNRQPASGPMGVFRESHSYDIDDNVTSIAFFSADGQPTVNRSGFYKQISTFEGGREVRTEYLNVSGKPTMLGGGYVAIQRGYDSRGNAERLVYLDANNRPVRNKYEGFAIRLASFDACGRTSEIRFLDENENLIPLKGQYAIIKKLYDAGNNVVDEAYLDKEQRPVRSTDGYARVKRKFDRHRNVIEEQYLDEHGKALRIKGTYSKLSRQYDDHSALIEESYFGVSGQPVQNDKGWARITYVYDALGRAIEQAHFGVHGEPVIDRSLHYHRGKRVLDERKNLLELSAFGTDGKPLAILTSDGKRRCARLVYRYNLKGTETGSDCFYPDGRQVR